jgi:GMP synthase-like glutamine amidotransferase
VTELLVLLHHPDVGPSAFLEVLDDRRRLVPWRGVDLAAGEAVPGHLDGVAGVVSFGGPMSVTRPDDEPWMRDELAFLREAVERGVPVLGICLGSQLLATALGGEVAARRQPRAAFLPLRRTAAATGVPTVAGWPDGAAGLLLHEDEVVRAPEGAAPLLVGPDGEVAAWGVGSAVAIQAHPEVTTEQLERWVANEQLADLCARAGIDPAALVEEARRRERFTVPLGRALVGRWLDGPVREAVA